MKPENFAFPPGVVTDTSPVAPAPTTASIVVAFVTEKDAAAVPPRVTVVAPVRLVPVMVTFSPCAAETGEIPEMDGGGVTGGAGVSVFLQDRTIAMHRIDTVTNLFIGEWIM